jgi:hypothetical protein
VEKLRRRRSVERFNHGFQSILKVVKIVIPGGSGQIGQALTKHLSRRSHEVVVLSRHPREGEIAWDGEHQGPWAEEIDGADAVINLAGRSVNCRYNAANRREIMASRINTVRAVGEAIVAAKRPPAVWLQASTATIYAHRYDAPNDEATGIIEAQGPDTWRFSFDVATAWERALEEAPAPHTRKVALRSAIVMGPQKGGAFDVLSTLVRRGLGGTQGNGHQFVSWIHEQDFAAAIEFLLERDLAGPVNLAAPNPLPNREFMRSLRTAWGVPFGVPTPAPLLEIGAWAMGTETELVLKSRRVVPRRLEEAGFSFQFPLWPQAAKDLVARATSSS